MIHARKIAVMVLLVVGGCAQLDTATNDRAREHLAELKPPFDYGVENYPGAQPRDKAIWRKSWDKLNDLLTNPPAQPVKP